MLTDLSLQEYWQLRRSGYRPAGLCGATGVFYVVSAGRSSAPRSVGAVGRTRNSQISRKVSTTRAKYDRPGHRQAQAGRAVGLVGVSLSYDVKEIEVDRGGGHRTDLMVTMHALGTAVAEDKPVQEPPPRLALDLSVDPGKDHLLGGMR